jgi:hypothetical protein
MELTQKPTADCHAPAPTRFVSSPLRNRIRVELNAPVSEVLAPLGDLARFPEYSSGLERIEAKTDSSGTCTEYVCHFKAREPGQVGIVHRELIRW